MACGYKFTVAASLLAILVLTHGIGSYLCGINYGAFVRRVDLCEMKAFLIFQSVARGLEAVSRQYLASIGGLGRGLRSLRGRAPMTRKVTRLAPCNTLGKQAYVKAIKVNEAPPARG